MSDIYYKVRCVFDNIGDTINNTIGDGFSIYRWPVLARRCFLLTLPISGPLWVITIMLTMWFLFGLFYLSRIIWEIVYTVSYMINFLYEEIKCLWNK